MYHHWGLKYRVLLDHFAQVPIEKASLKMLHFAED